MNLRLARLRSLVGAYPELLAVVVAAAIGLSVQPPLAWLAAHEGINVLLAILVFSTAITVEPGALRHLGGIWAPDSSPPSSPGSRRCPHCPGSLLGWWLRARCATG